jgi:fatty-acyl-CoA synthase
MTHGAALVLQPAFDPDDALELIEKQRCTVAYTLPNMTNALLGSARFQPQRVATLRTGLTLGTESDLRRAAGTLGVREICNIYGGTETYGNCCVTPHTWPLSERARCQGPPLPGVSLRIVDPDTGAEVERGAVGEIRVRGYLARGYLRDSTGAGKAFGADGWYRSGDLGWLDGAGNVHFSARATEMIKTRGINVSPLEVEQFIAELPGVRSVAITGVPDAAAGEVVVAFVVPDGSELDPRELRRQCERRIASYKVPERIHIVSELPKTDTGKLARRELPALDQSMAGEAARR